MLDHDNENGGGLVAPVSAVVLPEYTLTIAIGSVEQLPDACPRAFCEVHTNLEIGPR